MDEKVLLAIIIGSICGALLVITILVLAVVLILK
jgi:hypothetical protein